MTAILLVITAYALAAWALHSTVKHFGDPECSIWHILAILAVARLSARGLLMLLPNVDALNRLGIGFLAYAVVISIALGTWGRVPWGRSVAWGTGIAVIMFVGSIAAVAFLPSSTAAPSSAP
jgi:hypothetical protein